MDYTYYPGCSLSATGCAYDQSTRAVAATLGIGLHELDDWSCCGATTYMSVRELLSVTISARNLSLAQRAGRDLIAPCSACFTVLRKTDHNLQEMPQLQDRVAELLHTVDLAYEPGSVRVRHLLEAVVAGDGLDRIRALARSPLSGLRVAPYYGCQIVRPRVTFDHPELPTSLDEVIAAIGARPVYYPVKARCCGASLVASSEAAAFRLSKNLLLAAQQNGAHCIVTLCPLCHMNLDAFQDRINAVYGTHFAIPVLYFTQLMGLAFGLAERQLGIGREIVDPRPLLARHRPAAAAAPVS